MKDTGGPAFPTDHSRDEAYTNITGGMSLRDYFAAHAPISSKAMAEAFRLDSLKMSGAVDQAYEMLAVHAYRFADAMLAERQK